MLRLEFIHSSRHVFAASERATIRRICDQVEVEVRELLPQLPVRLWVTVEDGSHVIPELGSLGVATDWGQIRWRVDTTRREGVAALASLHLRATLYHELHHVARRCVQRAPRLSLIDGVVSEGLATAFERDCAGHHAPWAQYPPDVRDWVDELLALPDDAPRAMWMFRHSDGRRWIGYRAGTFLVDQAMARTRRSAADFVVTPAAEILALALPFG